MIKFLKIEERDHILFASLFMDTVTDFKELNSATKRDEQEIIWKDLSITIEPKKAPSESSHEAVFEVVFNDATEVFVNDSLNLFKHYVRIQREKTPLKELNDTKIDKEGGLFELSETYLLNPRALPYKLTYSPRVIQLYIICSSFMAKKQ